MAEGNVSGMQFLGTAISLYNSLRYVREKLSKTKN